MLLDKFQPIRQTCLRFNECALQPIFVLLTNFPVHLSPIWLKCGMNLQTRLFLLWILMFKAKNEHPPGQSVGIVFVPPFFNRTLLSLLFFIRMSVHWGDSMGVYQFFVFPWCFSWIYNNNNNIINNNNNEWIKYSSDRCFMNLLL